MFCLQRYQELRIDRSLVHWSYPQDRINTQVIYWLALALVECTTLFLMNKCKQKISSLSLLVGTTVTTLFLGLIIYWCKSTVNNLKRIGHSHCQQRQQHDSLQDTCILNGHLPIALKCNVSQEREREREKEREILLDVMHLPVIVLQDISR